ncbi:MAG TPA: hypothetical protein PKD99_05070 [Sphingopyxis sp.]|nr:hypothetical protein [Sphingopyxis sp.]HMP44457.1 hypothetical protein [Sphingopyxis sp.]HMQ19527.1 hypothetical protein [Sphingopyxis sp.]
MATAAAPAPSVLHPLHAILLAFPVAMFTGALLSDITYLNSAEIQWTNFSAWLITGALLFGAPLLPWSILPFLRGRRAARRGRALLYPVLVWLMWIAGLLNAFQHGRDGWSSVGTTGLVLSVLSTLAALLAGWIGYGAGRRGR